MVAESANSKPDVSNQHQNIRFTAGKGPEQGRVYYQEVGAWCMRFSAQDLGLGFWVLGTFIHRG